MTSMQFACITVEEPLIMMILMIIIMIIMIIIIIMMMFIDHTHIMKFQVTKI